MKPREAESRHIMILPVKGKGVNLEARYADQNRSTKGARARRYQANGRRVIFPSKWMNPLTAAQAEKNDTPKPIIRNGRSFAENNPKFWYISYPVAANMMGTAAMNEYSAAGLRPAPSSIPPMIVAADLENPGHKERH